MLTNVAPIDLVRKTRYSEIQPTQYGNFVGLTPSVARARPKPIELEPLPEAFSKSTVKSPVIKMQFRRKVIEASEVSDFQPLGIGNQAPWDAIHDGVLKHDMPGQRIKMQNGYQYELGNKFPF